MTKLRVVADVWYDGAHFVRRDCDTGEEIEEGRWCASIETPDGEITWTAKSPGAVVNTADRWGAGRGLHVEIHFLTPVGG
jgi:hypothetical protein